MPSVSLHKDSNHSHSNEHSSEHDQLLDSAGKGHSTHHHLWRNMFNVNQKNELLVGLIMLCTLLTDTTNKVSFRIMLYSMKPYAYYVNQLNTITSIPAYYMLYRLSLYYTPMDQKDLHAMYQFPKSHFAIMALFDATTSMINFIASSYISGPITILLMQTSIPMSILFSYVYLHSRYAKRQYIGACIVMIGIFISVYPSLHNSNTDTSLFWVIVYIVGQAPQSFSNVYRENVFRNSGVTIESNYLNYWLSIYQFIVTIPMIYPSFHAAGIPLDNVFSNFTQGTRCWLTGNSGTSYDCSAAPLTLNIFLIANVLSHTFQVLTVEYGSAALLTLLSALRIPLANLAFSLPSIAGTNASPLKYNELIALGIILIGVSCYKFNFVSKLNLSLRHGINTGITYIPHEIDSQLKYSHNVPDAILQYRKLINSGVQHPIKHLLFGTEQEPLTQITVQQQQKYNSII